MTLSAALRQPSAYDQAVDRLLEGLEPDPPPGPPRPPLDMPLLGIRPQPGPQQLMGDTPADVAIIGGSLFGGKTWSLVCEPLRHVHVPGFTFVAFRRERDEITNPGGMWDESAKWYPLADGTPREHTREWFFPTGAKGKFAGLQYDKDLENWKGAQVALFLFDQLELFTQRMFWYLFSRNRSDCGVRPYIRASCNPVPDDDPVGGWLAVLLAWWIDQETGYAIPERSGTIRWFLRVDDTIVWAPVTCPAGDLSRYARREADARAWFETRYPEHAGDGGRFVKSFTFILARLQDNAIGNRVNPEYEGNVRALPYVERERLLGGDRGGNWKIRATAGKVFNRAWFKIVAASPRRARRVRYWDKAGTEGGGKRTSGVRMAETEGLYYIEDVVTGQWSAGNREKTIRETAEFDGVGVQVWVEQEPGSGGKESAENTVRNLAGYTIRADKVTGDKIERAGPLSAQAEAGNVLLVKGEWNEAFLKEAHAYEEGATFMDQIDAAAGAFNKLAKDSAVVATVKAGETVSAAVPPAVTVAEGRRRRRERESEQHARLRSLVEQLGSDAVESVYRLTDPTFTLPIELRGVPPKGRP